MKIDLTNDEIQRYAALYIDKEGDDAEIIALMKRAKKCGHMTQKDLVAVAEWKIPLPYTQHICNLCKKNSEEDIKSITAIAFTAESERLRMGVLCLLHGVNWAMASVILHLGFLAESADKGYPLLDKWAMEAIGSDEKYNFKKWQDYVNLCRQAAVDRGVDLRTLDRALWAYGKFGK